MAHVLYTKVKITLDNLMLFSQKLMS